MIRILHQGFTEELVAKFPHLTLAQVHEALAHCYDNWEEVEKVISGNPEEAVRQRLPL